MEAANVHVDPRFSGRGPFKDTATVKIVVEDADEPPVFSSPTYLLEVHENAALNSVIGQVTARDPDITSSPIRYISLTGYIRWQAHQYKMQLHTHPTWLP